MAEDIQGLLEKIHSDGIQKAEKEKTAILTDARIQAAKIIEDAKIQAEAFARKSEETVRADEEKGKAAIRQAARDAVLALRADLQTKLNAVVHACVGEAMKPELMEQIILQLAAAYVKNPNAEASVEVLLSQRDQAAVEAYLKTRLLASLKAQPVIRLTNEFNSGLQISFRGSDVYFDFSDDALAEVLCRFVGPKLASVIKD
ncbi:MAG: V-type ATP synthase subunit E [Lentisphaerae bacterium ADurb.Bin242]|nr:MAG: V-type ATP synthase subunit E [Lentisphaerae bacterium ADurb.Bin242]